MLYKHKKNNHIYLVIDEVKMKDSVTKRWTMALLYKDVYDPINTYVREKKDFLEGFEPYTMPIEIQLFESKEAEKEYFDKIGEGVNRCFECNNVLSSSNKSKD